jgi:hypothetical protein
MADNAPTFHTFEYTHNGTTYTVRIVGETQEQSTSTSTRTS